MSGSPSPVGSSGGDGGFFEESESTGSLSYFERKYGGGGDEDGVDFDLSSFAPSYDATDKGECRRRGGGSY